MLLVGGFSTIVAVSIVEDLGNQVTMALVCHDQCFLAAKKVKRKR